MDELGESTTKGSSLSIKSAKPAKARFVLVWVTAVPNAPADGYSGTGYKQAITDVAFTG